MKRLLLLALVWPMAFPVFAQVDTEHRRLLALQAGFPLVHGEEPVISIRYFGSIKITFPHQHSVARVLLRRLCR